MRFGLKRRKKCKYFFTTGLIIFIYYQYLQTPEICEVACNQGNNNKDIFHHHGDGALDGIKGTDRHDNVPPEDITFEGDTKAQQRLNTIIQMECSTQLWVYKIIFPQHHLFTKAFPTKHKVILLSVHR